MRNISFGFPLKTAILRVLILLLLLSSCSFPPAMPAESSFEVHYLDVGQADATLIFCDGEYLLLDGGNSADSGFLYSYLKKIGATHLRYILCSHFHEDHLGGLAGALNYASVDTVFCPGTEDASEAFRDFQKYLPCPITVPSPGDTFSLGSAECTVLAVNTQPDHPNNSSIVLKVRYGDTAFLFCGDAEEEVEQFLLDTGADISCTVLKVPHHGSDTSLSADWLRAVNPQYAVISCGKDNPYGHPAPVTLEKLAGNQVRIFRTDLLGHIWCRSDGKNVTFETQKTDPVPPDILQDTSAPQNYVLNHNTEVFHLPNCSSVPKISDKNREYVTAARDELIKQGFSPCGNCHP